MSFSENDILLQITNSFVSFEDPYIKISRGFLPLKGTYSYKHAFTAAAKGKHRDILRYLSHFYITRDDLVINGLFDLCTELGRNDMKDLMKSGDLPMIKKLLTPQTMAPIYHTVQSKNIEVVSYVYDIWEKECKSSINFYGDIHTCLKTAAGIGHYDIFLFFMNKIRHVPWDNIIDDMIEGDNNGIYSLYEKSSTPSRYYLMLKGARNGDIQKMTDLYSLYPEMHWSRALQISMKYKQVHTLPFFEKILSPKIYENNYVTDIAINTGDLSLVKYALDKTKEKKLDIRFNFHSYRYRKNRYNKSHPIQTEHMARS